MTRTTYILNGIGAAPRRASYGISQQDAFAVNGARGTALVNGRIGAAQGGNAIDEFLSNLAEEGVESLVNWITTNVGQMFEDLFGPGPSQWDNAGPGVHQWFTSYGPQAFLDWMRANRPNAFGSLDGVFALYALWRKMVGWPAILPRNGAPGGYSANVTPQAYAAMGMDYAAMIQANDGSYILTADAATGPSPVEVQAIRDAYGSGGRVQPGGGTAPGTGHDPSGAEVFAEVVDEFGSAFGTTDPLLPPPPGPPPSDDQPTPTPPDEQPTPPQFAGIPPVVIYGAGAYAIGKILRIF